jgi:methionine synthase II (cobalamin-independent)
VRDVLAQRHEMDPGRVRSLLDDLVRFAIRLQEQAGLDVVSDGEWRRIRYVSKWDSPGNRR